MAGSAFPWVRYCPYKFGKFEFASELPIELSAWICRLVRLDLDRIRTLGLPRLVCVDSVCYLMPAGYMLQGGCAILKPGQKKSIKLVMPQSGSSDDYAEIKFFKDSLLREKLSLKSKELSDYLKGEKHVEASTVLFGVTGVEETPTKPKKPFEPIYICEVCTKAFKYMGQLQIHRTKKHGAIEKKFPCTLCKYEGFTQKHLNRHVKREHTEKNRSSITKIHCERCDKEFPSDVTYNIHFAANHVPTKCKVEWCGKESSNRIQDRMHRERAHSRDQGQTKHSEKKIPEPCNVCGKELKSASGMRYHILNHKVTVEPQGGDLLEIGGEETIGESVIQVRKYFSYVIDIVMLNHFPLVFQAGTAENVSLS